jgi:hypothetical protein
MTRTSVFGEPAASIHHRILIVSAKREALNAGAT